MAEEPAPEPVADAPEPVAPASNGVSTWSSASVRPGSATGASAATKVSFLVVSGAALVVTGLVAARRGGRH